MKIKDKAAFVIAMMNYVMVLVPPFNGWNLGNFIMGSICLYISLE